MLFENILKRREPSEGEVEEVYGDQPHLTEEMQSAERDPAPSRGQEDKDKQPVSPEHLQRRGLL